MKIQKIFKKKARMKTCLCENIEISRWTTHELYHAPSVEKSLTHFISTFFHNFLKSLILRQFENINHQNDVCFTNIVAKKINARC